MDKIEKRKIVKESLNLITNNRYSKRMRFLLCANALLIIGLATMIFVKIGGELIGQTLVLFGICMLIFIIGAFSSIFGYIFSIGFFRARKAMFYLIDHRLYEMAISEFRADTLKSVAGTKNYYSANFLYCYSGEIFCLKDIIWIYIQSNKTKAYGLTVAATETVVAGLISGKRAFLFLGATKNFNAESLNSLFMRIKSLNPSLMLGYTKENNKTYIQLVKATKDRFQ